jgi:hypothetical protein
MEKAEYRKQEIEARRQKGPLPTQPWWFYPDVSRVEKPPCFEVKPSKSNLPM